MAVSSLVTLGMGSGPGGMVTMGLGPSMSISTVSFSPSAAPDAAAAWGAWNAAWVGKKKYPWIKDEETYPSVYVVRAMLIDINGKELPFPVSTSTTQAYNEGRKPRVRAIFKWAKVIKASVNNIFINALRVFRGKEIEDEEFYE